MKTTLWTRIYLFQSLKDRVSREMLVNMKQAAALYSFMYFVFVLYCTYTKTIQYNYLQNTKRNVDVNAITIAIENSNAKRLCPSSLILLKSHLNFSIIFVVTFTVSL